VTQPRAGSRPFIIAAAAVCGAWAIVVTVWPDAPFALTFDDAYYYFEVARNIAHGFAPTFDRINATNGYHPLWMAICSLPYLVGLDGLAAVRALLVLELVGWFATLALISRIVVDARGGWARLGDRPGRAWCDRALLVTFVLVAANPFVLKLFVNGLESGLVGLCGAALLVRATAVGGRFLTGSDARWRWWTGALLAVTFLSRTDAVILFGVLGVWCLLEARRLRPLVELFALPALTIAGYTGVNLVAYGHLTQVSGEVKRLPLTGARVVEVALFALAAVAVLLWGRRPVGPSGRFARVSTFARATAWYAAACIALVAYYVVLQAVPYLWYFAPLGLYATILLLLAVADFTEGALLEANVGVRPLKALAPVLAILLVPLAGGAAYQSSSFVDPRLRSIQTTDRRAGEWISAHLPRDAVLGSFDAGVIGYFTDQPVINLDGVISSFDYLDARRSGADATSAFLRERGITHLVNHGLDVAGEDPDMRRLADALLGKGTGRALRLVERWPFLYSGSLDGNSGGSGLKHLAVFLYEIPPKET
jgi:hypothetical protein